MHLTFWGVRGSYPVPGAATVRYGGHTSCVELRSESGGCLVIDAGTGLRGLGQKLAQEARDPGGTTYNLILSHVHWDHIQGLPFFEPAYIGDTKIVVHAPRAAAKELRLVIGGITRHEFFPVALDAVPADFEFQEVTPGKAFDIDEFTVLPIGLNHPFGAVGYRVDADGSSMAYVSDTAPFDRMLHKQHFTAGVEEPNSDDLAILSEMRANLVQSLRRVDTVIYDTHFTKGEYEQFTHWGHSTPDHALEICHEAGVRQLVLYHHAPAHDDDAMDKIAEQYGVRGKRMAIAVCVAREAMTLTMGEATNPGFGV
ncbi:MAG: MBL fold metallo-hydrolase [Myxococcales bacterium]|nr:MBL fold metallo-hydrolase [Myxococcales bacterium]